MTILKSLYIGASIVSAIFLIWLTLDSCIGPCNKPQNTQVIIIPGFPMDTIYERRVEGEDTVVWEAKDTITKIIYIDTCFKQLNP